MSDPFGLHRFCRCARACLSPHFNVSRSGQRSCPRDFGAGQGHSYGPHAIRRHSDLLTCQRQPQGQLTIFADVAINEVLQFCRDLAAFKIKAAQ